LPGDFGRPAPCIERRPTVVFTDPALGNDRADFHPLASVVVFARADPSSTIARRSTKLSAMTYQKTAPEHVPMTEEQIRAAWVVEPTRLDGAVTLVEYDPAWPQLFERENERMRRALGGTVVRLEHTGSTSVPALVAKPIIDMLLVLPDSSDEATYLPALEAAGYKLVIREPDWNEHPVLKGPDTNINMHVLSAGSPEIERILAFRDWLRSHDEDRDLYERTKRELAAQNWAYVQNYADAKTDIVEAIIAKALAAQAAK